MKSAALVAVTVVFGMVLGSPLPAPAQQQPLPVPGLTVDQTQPREKVLAPAPFTVSFGGEMRTIGIAMDNSFDFTDSRAGRFRDSQSRVLQRFRLFTTIESADRKVRAYWALEIGDVTLGAGGGSNGAEYNCPGAAPVVNPTVTVPPPAGSPPGTASTPTVVTPGTPSGSTRVGNGAGGCLGADGVNVETKNLYLQFDMPGFESVNLLLGIHRINFLVSPTGAFMDDDAATIQFNWKRDPLDLQLYVAKVSEGDVFNADDNNMYTARLGVTLTPDTRLTAEAMVIDAQCFARTLVATPGATTPTRTGPCAGADFGDNLWVGLTGETSIGSVRLNGSVVYGQRALLSDGLGRNIKESGFGYQVTARTPAGPAQLTLHHWYTSGDENRIVGLNPSASRSPGPGQDFVPISFTTRLNRDSTKLPLPVSGTSWVGAPFVAEAFFGHQTIGLPDIGQPHYGNPTGTWGVGGSAVVPVAAGLALGGGVGFLAASEDNGIFGDHLVEVDAGVLYMYNANLSFRGLATYSIPDAGDSGWSAGFLARFSF
jgi:hypothetical protein